MKFRDRIVAFMYGRYGVDTLYYFTLFLYLALVIVRLFTPDFVGIILSAAQTLLLIVIFFRIFSRNIPARRRENEKFKGIFRSTKNFFVHQKNRIRDINKYRYRKCPGCGAALRLPVKTGRHNVTCPRCRLKFEVKVRF